MTVAIDTSAASPRRHVQGPVLLPGEPGFEEATALWNGMIRRSPALAVRPSGAADVAVTVDFARTRGLPVSVRGGGHNIAGAALVDGGIVLDMSAQRSVEVDPVGRTATVQPGCRLGDVDRATQEHGLATPLGFISEVGVAGLTLGGGLGYLTRRFGWTVDNLLAVDVVTADGELRRTSREEEPDLFWAIRGAGSRLGVVTSFEFRLHPVGPAAYGGLVAWPFERAAEILRAYREITARAPRELAVWLNLMRAPEAPFVPPAWHGRRVCAMAVCYTGEPSRAAEALAPVRALGDPVVDLLREQPYVDIQSYLDQSEPAGNHYYWRTAYLAELADGLLEEARELFAGCPAPEAQLGILHLGGALNERPEDDGAVGNRDARFAIGANGMWAPGDPGAETFERWVRDAGNRLRSFSTGREYVNFQAADERDRRAGNAYGPNLARLLEVKRRFDPHAVFGPVTGP